MTPEQLEAIRLLEDIQKQIGDAADKLRLDDPERGVSVTDILTLMLNLAVGIGHIVAMFKMSGSGTPQS